MEHVGIAGSRDAEVGLYMLELISRVEGRYIPSRQSSIPSRVQRPQYSEDQAASSLKSLAYSNLPHRVVLTTSDNILSTLASLLPRTLRVTYKTRRNSNDIEFMMRPVLKRNTRLGKLLDRIVLDINNIHILPVELLVVIILQARSLDAKVMRHVFYRRRKKIPLLRVTDPVACLFRPELVRLLIRLGIEQVVLVHSNPVPKTAILPDLLIQSLTVLGRIIKGVLLVPVVVETRKAIFAVAEQLGVELLGLVLLLGGGVLATHGDGEVGGSLEDLEMSSLGTPGLRDLHA